MPLNISLMKKYIFILTVLLLIGLYSCGAGSYTILVNNNTDYDKEIKVKAFDRRISFYKNKGEFSIGKLIKNDSLKTTSEFYSFTLPAGQTLLIRGMGITFPTNEAIILNNKDTLLAKGFSSKSSVIGKTKWAYSIKE